jgi:hypothetical protein
MNSWIEQFKGNDRLNHFGNARSCLEEVEVFEVNFHRDGPRVEVKINICQGLELGGKQFENRNALIINLGFYGVSNVSMHGWDVKNIAHIKADSLNNKLKVKIIFSEGAIEFDCIAARVVDLQAYLNEH